MFLLFSSCSTDSEVAIDKNLISNPESHESKATFPLSSKNPYDSQGLEYYKTLQKFLKENSYPNSAAEISKQISFLSVSGKENRTGKAFNLGYSEQEILEILDSPETKLIEIVENSSISSSSKMMVNMFVQSLIVQKNSEYASIRNYIIDFDADIISNEDLNSEEKETILTVSTISSYALFAEAERKDRDWEKSVGTKPARPLFKANEVSITTVIALLKKLL